MKAKLIILNVWHRKMQWEKKNEFAMGVIPWGKKGYEQTCKGFNTRASDRAKARHSRFEEITEFLLTLCSILMDQFYILYQFLVAKATQGTFK